MTDVKFWALGRIFIVISFILDPVKQNYRNTENYLCQFSLSLNIDQPFSGINFVHNKHDPSNHVVGKHNFTSL